MRLYDHAAETLAACKRAVHAFDTQLPIERAETPPASWYTWPVFHALERDALWSQQWRFAARADQVAEPGAYVALTLEDTPVVVLRDEEGTLRAFANVCRHHAAIIMHGEGHVDRLTCPYHGWQYRLDGQLLRAPQLGAIKDFERDRFSLPALPVDQWQGLVFVHLGQPNLSLDTRLAPFTKRIVDRTLNDLSFVERRVYEMACDWKVFVDNYLDGGYRSERESPEACLGDESEQRGE